MACRGVRKDLTEADGNCMDKPVTACYTETDPEAFFLCYFEPTNTLNGSLVLQYGCRAPALRGRKIPGLSGDLGMAKVSAAGTHLAEARSQSAQGRRVIFEA